MTWWGWALYGILLCLVQLPRLRQNSVRAEVMRLSHAWRLPQSWTTHADATAFVRRRQIAAITGGAVGLAVGIVVSLSSVAADIPPIQAAPVFGLAIGQATGSAVAGILRLPRRTPGLRATHAREIVLRDYLPRPLIVATWLVPVLAAVATVVALVAESSADRPAAEIGSVVLAGLGLLAAAGFPLVARRATTAAWAARTDLELAWQDGFRARTVVDCAVMVMALAVASSLLALLPILSWDSNLGYYWAILAGCAAGIIALGAARPNRTFRTRLWQDRLFDLEGADLYVDIDADVPSAGRRS